MFLEFQNQHGVHNEIQLQQEQIKDNPKSWMLYRDVYSVYSTQLFGFYFTQLIAVYEEYYSTQVLGLYFSRTTRSRGNERQP